MEIACLAVIIFLLVILVVEVHLLRQKMALLASRGQTSAEEKSSTPTINVNVGVGGALPVAPATVDKSLSPVGEPSAALKDSPADEDAPVVPKMPVVRVSPSGVTILKCTACGSENSSFRKECFKCGAKLS